MGYGLAGCGCFRRLHKNILLVFSISLSVPAFAGWQAETPMLLPPNVETTISLERMGGNEESTTAPRLWLINRGSTKMLHPEVVTPVGKTAEVPVFVRGEGDGALIVYDSFTATTSSIEWSAINSQTTAAKWLPRLEITGFEDFPMAYGNQPVTATLILKGGVGAMPPSAHIQAKDHRGRLVLAQHFSTFELLAGQQTVVFPAAGYYEVKLSLLENPVTSLPRAVLPDARPVPFGKTVADVYEPQPLADGVTTDSIIGTVIALEHLPTTATVVAEDKFFYAIFGKHSLEIQKNRWPFGISGVNLMEMSSRERKEFGEKLLRWHRLLGSSFAPVTLQWSEVQRSPGSYSWSLLNSVLNTHRKIMVRPIITLTGPARWNNSLPSETSATLDAWTGFTRHLSEKYLKLMWGLQVWDEPEKAFTPEGYAEVVEATITGFSTRQGHTIAAPPVIVGGTEGVKSEFLNEALTSYTANRTSLSFKFQPEKPDLEPEAAGLVEAIRRAAEVMRSNKAADPHISVTNLGYSNGPAGVTEKLQANYLVRAYVLAISNGAYKLIWNSLYDKTPVPWAQNSNDRTGLLDTDLFPKMSGVSFNILSYLLSGVTPAGVSSQGTAEIHKFNLPVQDNKWAGTIYVAWTESPNQVQDITLEMTNGGGAYFLDYLGAEVHARKVAEDSANNIEGSYQIPVGFEPVFIWDAGKPGQTE